MPGLSSGPAPPDVPSERSHPAWPHLIPITEVEPEQTTISATLTVLTNGNQKEIRTSSDFGCREERPSGARSKATRDPAIRSYAFVHGCPDRVFRIDRERMCHDEQIRTCLPRAR